MAGEIRPVIGELPSGTTSGIFGQRGLLLSDGIARVAPVELRVRRADERTIAVLARGLGIRDVTARVLIARGVVELPVAQRYLAPRLGELRPPVGLAGFERGVARIAAAVLAGEVIGVFGDYDVDGVTTAALLTSFLRSVGARVEPAVAHREQGYGFSPEVAASLLARGAQLIITGDCGTSDLDAIAVARARGIDVVIIDHHTVPPAPAEAIGDAGVPSHPAYALINPYCHDSRFPFRGLASVGLAFYVAGAVRTALRKAGHFAERAEPDVRELLDLVALGTIADLVPLTDENRTLVHHGLLRLTARSRPGIAALLAGMEVAADAAVDEKLVSWKLAPRLNAPGRLGPAEPSLAVLLADVAEAAERAAAVESANAARRTIQDQVYAEALELLGDGDPGPAIVLGKAGWPSGVVGIIAAKLVDLWQRPAFVVGIDATTSVGRGSARTAGGVDLYQALRGAAAHLDRYGGHAAAAGFSIRADRPEWLGELRGALTSSVNALAQGTGPVASGPGLEVDAELPLSHVTPRLVRELEQLGPFGQGNPVPKLLVRSAIVLVARWVGDGSHLQLTLGDGRGVERRAIFFRASSRPGLGDGALAEGQRVHVVFTPSLSVWNGRERIDLEVVEIIPVAAANASASAQGAMTAASPIPFEPDRLPS
jgi:single-stranded-DNA-specific exonuclease